MDTAVNLSMLCVLALCQLPLGAAVELRGESDSVYPWVIVVLVLVVVGLLTVTLVEIVIVYKVVRLGGVPWRSVWLGQLLLVAITLSYVTLILFVFKPTRMTCNAIRFSVGVCYIFILSVLLVKALLVLSPKTQAGFLKLGHQVLILCLLVSVQVIINTEWIILRDSGEPDTLTNDARRCTSIHLNKLFSDFLLSFIYLLLVGVVTVALSLRAYTKGRKGGGKPDTEAKWILITTVVNAAACLVWVIVGALLLNPEAPMAALAIGLWTTATATLLIMFLPKLHKLATLKDGEFYYEDEIPGLVGYSGEMGEGVELQSRTEHNGGISEVSHPPDGSVIYTPSDINDGGTLLTTLDRPPSVILEERSESNASMSSIGPSPSVVYKANNPDKVFFTSDPHALRLQHPVRPQVQHPTRPLLLTKTNHYPTLSSHELPFSDYGPPPQRYYTIGGHGRRHPSHSVIGAPRYERRYVPVHHTSHTMEPQYVREVVVNPHTHHPHHTMTNGYHRYAGSSSAESHRYTGGSSSGSGVDSPAGYPSRYAPTPSRSASAIGIPKYEGPAAKKYLNGYTNHSFSRSASNLSLDEPAGHPGQPVQYVEVSTTPRKASSVVGAPSYRSKTLKPLNVTNPSLISGRRTLSQQDLRGSGLTLVAAPEHRDSQMLLTGTLPSRTKLVYRPAHNGRLLPVERRQRAFRDDVMERSSVY